MRRNWLVPLLLAALLLALALPALAAGTEVRVTGPEAAPGAGDSFDLTLELRGNPGCCLIDVQLDFPADAVQCTGIDEGPVLQEMLSVTNPAAPTGAIVTGIRASLLHKDGVIAVLHFTALRELDGTEFTLRELTVGDFDGAPLPLTVLGPGPFGTPPETSEPPETTETPQESESPETTQPPQETEPPETTEPPVSPTQEPQSAPDFPDIAGHWGEDSIRRAAELGLFRGYADGSFGPDKPVTRAQFLAVLYRLAGSPTVKGVTAFEDVGMLPAEFRFAIAWGHAQGYVQGRSDTIFDPGAAVTRQEAMKVLFAMDGGQSGAEALFTAFYEDAYTDSGSIADWARPAMYWGVYHGLITGTSKTTLSPRSPASRAQLARILVNYVDKR
ncbi:MAG: S-layer homology domain-containing protein [Oscillospiraceae bacterium]|nr:S-layer homology domain-containing protein [Oscillospiraceae bacterium]